MPGNARGKVVNKQIIFHNETFAEDFFYVFHALRQHKHVRVPPRSAVR
jgi:hypothetical protein